MDEGADEESGYANEVLGDLLGTSDEKIEIVTVKAKRKPSSLLMDALRCTNEIRRKVVE